MSTYRIKSISPGFTLILNVLLLISQPVFSAADVEDDPAQQAETEAVDAEPAEVEEEYNIHRVVDPDNPCDRGRDTYDYDLSWYDESQIYVNSRFCEPALWFDNFFANDRIFKEGVAGTYIRWRNDFTYDEEEYFSFSTYLTASVELPGLRHRVRLTLESDEDEDLRDIAPGGDTNNTNNLGLQFDLLENIRSKINITVSLSPRIRLRYRYTYPATETITMRLTQELQREKTVHSARTQFDFEKILEQDLLLRATSEGKFSEEYDGMDWLQALVLFKRLSKKSSISYESSVNGITEPLALATNFRLGVRYRKNFHRKWLFYEIAPEMTWPIALSENRRLTERNRHSKWLIFFRFEAHFGNASKKRYQDHI